MQNNSLKKNMKRTPRQPERNYRCPRYDECLTVAAVVDWPLACDGCVNEQTVERAILELPDVWACLRLVWTLFNDGEPFDLEHAQERLFDRWQWGSMPVTRQMRGT